MRDDRDVAIVVLVLLAVTCVTFRMSVRRTE